MIKRLLNLNTIQKITLILTTLLLLLPSTAFAEDSTPTTYGLTVGGVEVTSQNASNVFSSDDDYNYNRVSFTPATDDNSNNILTLNGAEISCEGTPVIVSSLQNLVIKLIGRNRLECGNKNVIFSTNQNGYLTLTYDNSNPDAEVSLILATNEDISVIEGFGGMACTLIPYVTNSDFYPIKEMTNVAYDNDYKVLKVNGNNVKSIYYSNQPISYGITIAGTKVNSNNASNVIVNGENNERISFDPETNTLTLNNAVLQDNIVCDITDLTIDLKGTSSITTNGKPAITTNLEDYLPQISIVSTDNSVGSLILKNTSQVNPCGGVVKGNISINAENPISILLPTDPNYLKMDTTHIAAFGKSYDLMVGGEIVSNINASDILGDGKAAYSPETKTLSLNGVTTSMIRHQAPQPLTIEISGKNTIGMIVGYGGDENPLTIKKSGSSQASLDINPGDQVLDDMGPVFHFSSCTWGDGLYLVAYSNNTTISGAYYDDRKFKHSTYSSIDRVIISTPSIWVGGHESNEDGKFTFNGDSIAGAWFDANSNTLTLSNALIYYYDNNIISSLPNLTIKMIGGDTNMGEYKIISTNPQATLKFTTNANNPGSISNSLGNNNLPWEGFFGNPTFENKLVYLPNHDSQSIKKLEAPSINYSNGNLEFGGLSDGYGNNYFDCHYTITYGDGTTENGQNNEQVSSLSVPKQQLTPCTVTAYAEFKDQFNNTTRSDNAIAYYLEFAEDMKVTFDGTEREIQKSDYPALIPDVEDIEFILSNSTNTNAICQETIGNESHIKIKGFGATDLILYNSKVLNNGGGSVALSATVVPSVPTFSIEPGTYNEAQTLTLASPYQKTNGDDQTVINIRYYTDGNSNLPVTYTEPISINQSTTITAWVEALITTAAGGAQETITSDTITQEYIIKKEANIDFKQEENGGYSTIGADQVITGTYGHAIPKVVMPYVSDLQGAITFSSSKETVVASSSISLDEEYTLKYTVSGAGQTTILANYTPGADEPFLSTTRNFNLKIEPRDISNATISMGTNGESSFVYNGAAIEPITSVSLAASGTAVAATLNAETDFNLNYYLVSGETETTLDGAPTNVGSYKVTVSAKGNYTGSKSATFTIIQTTITPTVEITGWTYGATANTPSVSGNTGNGNVTYEYKLQNAEDSKYNTEVPTEAGNYTIKATIAATANYEAAVDSTHFTISKANITPTVILEGWTFGATANTPSISGNTENGNVTYEYKLKTAEDSEYKADVPTEAGEYTIKATIAATANFEGATTTTDFTISKTSITPTVTLEGWTYGTTAKTPSVSGNTGNGSVTYEYKLKTAEDSEYKADAPTEAGDYTIKATIAATANYEAATATTDFTISKANITPTVTLEGWTYGATANTPTITGNTGNGTVTYTYKAEGAESFVETAPEAAGNYTIKASIAETTNYNSGEATTEFTITAATMNITAEGYEGTYDTQAHGITIKAPEGAVVKYGSQEGTYNLQNSPTYTDAGTYTVYYQVTMSNYTTVTGSKTVEISKANITPTVALEGWTYGTTANTPSITGNTGNGNVTYTYKAEGSETFVDTKPEVVGTHTIKASIAETTNYNAGEATAEFTITAATSSVTAKGYKGAYDKQAHGITVTAPEGSTVMYGTQEGTYEQSESPTYTNAGNYTVYYQVTKENYTTVTGSVTIEISKADITPTVTLEGWTYGTTAKTPNITGNTGEGTVTYTYKAEGADAFGETAPEVVGTHTVKASIAETTNYNAGEATATFTITAATMTVSAAGHEGTYDNKAHGITVTAPEGSKVMYGSQNGTYNLTEAPTYTDAGTYEVYYQVTMNNYTTVTGSETVNISKAAITPTVTLEGWTYGTTAKTPSITGNTGEGTVTYSYKAEGTESFVETKPLVVGTHTVKASIAETTNYNAGEATTTFTITAATMTITAAGHEGTYDGKAHGITVTAPEDATIKYGEQEGSYEQSEAPTYTDAGTYEVYYQVTMDNYTTVTGSATVEISKADITPTVTLEGWTYGATANTPTITGNTGNGTVTYTYKAEGAETFVETAPETAGNYTIKASIAETANYNAGEATTEFTITAATMNITAEGYEGTYDTQAHGITIKVPEGAVVKYRNQEGTYTLTEAPTYTNAGTYEVHYQVTMDNYTTVTSSATVKISKADITPTVTLEGWTYGTTAKTPSITGNPGEGTVTYSYKAEGAETFGKTAPEIVGTHTIKASIAETTNYNAGEATATFTITAATMTVTAKGYEGTYDGKAHGITVSAPEDATIKYGTAEGSYELNASPEYTAGGNYTVYYQVTMDNYATVTGSETVKISKAEAELEFDVPEESKVYATIGKEFTEPTLNNLKGLDVTFSSSDESVATVDKNTGKVTLKSAGLTYITATFAGNDNYNEFAVKYELRVKGSYNLWIDNVQVTSDNYNDILENQKFFYDLVNKWLIITNNETPVTVKSSMPELTIYLNGKSELERIYFDNQGNAQNTGTLSFFNYNDVPGKLTLDTNNDNGVISGFSSIIFDDNTKLRFIDPDSCEYKDGLVKMTKPSQLGEIVKQVTIGQYIEPMANGDGISFGNIDSETNITNMTIEDKLLITATQHEEGSNEDDDYIDPNNGAFVMNTTNTSEDVEVLSQGVEDGTKTPGSEDYADSFRGGITFMVPSGTGTIELELMNEEGYMLMLKIGTGVPHEIVRYERATVVIDYNVDEPTYVYLYLEEKSIIGARRAGNNTRVNKRDKAHGTVFSVKVKAASVSSTNPLNKVEGATGNITIPDVNTTTPSGDDVPTKAEFKITNDENKANDDKWYTIDGQRINKPTQKGLYIRNRKKVVVK